ncbi:MAPEG family protein [Thorsellia anophelis]|uniref:Uncharacterized conserved protein, MAPEG superfamily n=1 Tax=Thorsellia anophelis DSM 18579 TaxID=1123402 RepID=A0A1I0F3M8_9GAMM|nr:MAPEG family protein [Thorsellia anophelis]SET52627.1 Uncharacterized conserved protein, MAPEG superfamily [Thorsellia anophelis DSM 18579]
MTYIAIAFLIAGGLHILCAGLAKFGQPGFDNHHPRQWMATFTGAKARANAAQSNILESLPFFYAAALFALYMQVEVSNLAYLLWIWLGFRCVYIYAYIKDFALFRTFMWLCALITNGVILFSAQIFPAI